MPTAAMDLTSAPLNGFPTLTHTYTPVPEPASLANSYKTAAVCFLGFRKLRQKTSPSAKATALMNEIPPTCAGKKDTP